MTSNLFTRQFQCWRNARRLGVFFVRNRWFSLPAKLRVQGREVAVSYPNEHGISVDFIACVVRNDYGLGEQLSRVRTVLDIGANVGFFSLAARGRYPEAVIHAYEPNPRVLPHLTANTGPLGIHVFAEAVGARHDRVNMLDSGESNLASVQRSPQGAILQVPFSEALARLGGEVDLLKLDCEGAEWELFENESDWRSVRELRMEYHLTGGHSFQDVRRAVESLGFSITEHRPDRRWGILWASNRSFRGGIQAEQARAAGDEANFAERIHMGRQG